MKPMSKATRFLFFEPSCPLPPDYQSWLREWDPCKSHRVQGLGPSGLKVEVEVVVLRVYDEASCHGEL